MHGASSASLILALVKETTARSVERELAARAAQVVNICCSALVRIWPVSAQSLRHGMSAADAVDGSSTGATSATDVGAVRALMIRRSQVMQTITTVGLDIAKSVFQVHCVDADGEVVLRRQLKRRYVLAFFQKLPPCLVGIEACASSHHWSRELQALGHTVRLTGAMTWPRSGGAFSLGCEKKQGLRGIEWVILRLDA